MEASKNIMRDSFVFYRSFYESIKLLPKKYQTQCFEALCRYALDDVPFEGVPGTVEAILRSFKFQVDANNRKYENGKRGGRPKKNQAETKTKPNDNQSKSKHKPNDNVNVNVNVNDNVNDNVNVNVNDNDNYNNVNALGSSGPVVVVCSDGDDKDFDLWKKLTPDDVDAIYDAYPESGGFLIQEVYEEVKAKRRKVDNPVAYILGYAKNVRWDDNADHFEEVAP